MNTYIRYLFFTIILLLFFSGTIFPQDNKESPGVPTYMIRYNRSNIIKSTPSNNKLNIPLWNECHIDNGTSITFPSIGSPQESPDISIPMSNPFSPDETTYDPSITIDPMNKNMVFTAATVFIPGANGIDQEFSQTHGQTWRGGYIYDALGYGIPWFTPAVGIYRNGSSVNYYIGNEMAFKYPWDIWCRGQGITNSTDGGTSWTNTVIAWPPYDNHNEPLCLLFQNHLAVDNNVNSPYAGRVYSAWTPSTFGWIPYNTYGLPDWGKIDFTFSSDGTNWSLNDYIPISDMKPPAIPGTVFNYGVNLQTGNYGELYVVWAMYNNDPVNPTSGYPPFGPEFALGFTKSMDGGQTFDTAHKIIDNIKGVDDDEDFSGHQYTPYSFPVMCVDHSIVHHGRIYVAWSNLGFPGINLEKYADIYVIHSDNNGDSWSDPIKINTWEYYGTWDQKFSVFPWITCDNETGAVCVVFYDDRSFGAQDSRFDTYVSISRDGGTTWEESHSSINPSGEYGGINDNSFCSMPLDDDYRYFSSYNGISVKDGIAYPVWTSNTMVDISGQDSHPYTTVSPFYIWNCIPSYTLQSWTIQPTEVKKYECQDWITASDFMVSSGAFCFFDARNSIKLQSGFHAENGSYFHAYIDGCTPFNKKDANYSYYSGNSTSNSNRENNIYKTDLYDKLIKIYPNPTNGNLTIELGEVSGLDGKLIISNAKDESITQMNPSSNTSYHIDLSNYPKGIYFIKLFTQDRTYINKIIHQ